MTDLPIHLALDRAGVSYRRASFAITTEKGAANVAAALGHRERQIVKTLIFETGDARRALIMLGGDQSAVSGLLKKALGSRDVRMATPEAVVETTGYVIGSIPPVGWQSAGVVTLLERSLLDEPELGVGTGQWGEEVLIAPSDLVRASGARVVNLTDRERPIEPDGPTG